MVSTSAIHKKDFDIFTLHSPLSTLLTVLSNFVFNSVIGCSNPPDILITERLRQAVSRSFPYVDPLFYLSSFQTPSGNPGVFPRHRGFLRRVAADNALREPVCNRYTIGRARYRSVMLLLEHRRGGRAGSQYVRQPAGFDTPLGVLGIGGTGTGNSLRP